MRVRFVVREEGGAWVLRRGHTYPLRYDSYESAWRAAKALAGEAAEQGDTATVILRTNDGEEISHSFVRGSRAQVENSSGR